ncbi:MAG: TrmH family RNA methyltransferase, partial [Streptosporangiaceae bacterium]
MAGPEQLTLRSGRVRHARRLATRRFRAKSHEFLAEGPQAVREALTVPGVVLEVFATPEATRRYHGLTGSGVPWHVVGSDVVAGICETVHPQGLVARCRFVDTDLTTVLAPGPRLVVVCADIRDPGNAGTVLRCADAAGADAVVFTGDSVDPYNPKAVRASVGSLFHVRLAVVQQPADAVARCRSAGLTVLAADGTADLTLPPAAAGGLL